MEKYLCKITVMKKELYEDLQREFLADPQLGKCQYFEEGQEFLVDRKECYRMMNGKFCSEAWDCIGKYVYLILHGGEFYWTKEKNSVLVCCNDPTRPVIFKLERVVID